MADNSNLQAKTALINVFFQVSVFAMCASKELKTFIAAQETKQVFRVQVQASTGKKQTNKQKTPF